MNLAVARCLDGDRDTHRRVRNHTPVSAIDDPENDGTDHVYDKTGCGHQQVAQARSFCAQLLHLRTGKDLPECLQVEDNVEVPGQLTGQAGQQV